MLGVESGPGKIVDAQAAIANDPIELIDAYLPTIVLFESTAPDKSAAVNSKDERLKELGIAGVEGDV